jgi:hypothetical protein
MWASLRKAGSRFKYSDSLFVAIHTANCHPYLAFSVRQISMRVPIARFLLERDSDPDSRITPKPNPGVAGIISLGTYVKNTIPLGVPKTRPDDSKNLSGIAFAGPKFFDVRTEGSKKYL